MSLTPIECEARLMGFKKESRSDGEWTQLTFQIHPDDTPHALFLLPLKTHVKLAISGASEQPPAERPAPKIGPICMRAVLLCKRTDFQDWLASRHRLSWQGHYHTGITRNTVAAEVLRAICGVKSRKSLDDNESARNVFLRNEQEFYASQRGDTEEARLAQRDRR